MIYVCVATRNNGSTIGLLLWKLRKVFQASSREYHILVADDASTDGTRETLETYQRALPLTLIRHAKVAGRAACLDVLFRDALARTDRPKRDCVATLPPDFTVSPAVLPDLIRRFESGADVVIGETGERQDSWGMRLLRRSAPWLLRPGITVPGVRDLLSGVVIVRLVTLRNCYRNAADCLLESDGVSANAELLARAATNARQIATVTVARSENGPTTPAVSQPLAAAAELFRAGRQLSIPAPTAAVERT